ncbi:unnamed protein product [Bathycoccus prasinos]
MLPTTTRHPTSSSHDPSGLECLYASAARKKNQRVLKKGNYLDTFVARAIDWKEAKMLSTHFVYETGKIVARRQTGLGAKTYKLVMKNSKLLKSWAYYRLRIGYPNLREGERILLKGERGRGLERLFCKNEIQKQMK